MAEPRKNTDHSDTMSELLGYLNFSSGAHDPQFLANLSQAFAEIASSRAEGDTWVALRERLSCRLGELAGRGGAFEEVTQAKAALQLTLGELPRAYREFHRDLLFHQVDREIWQPFFVGRAFEAVLAEGGPWHETERILNGAIARLNDFIGYRPVPVLNNEQRMEPYPHEWVGPIPLYVRGAGVAHGRYRTLLERALQILQATDRDLLMEASFDPELMDELALDPRAYDFDHPVNKRPNYHFGQWDPHQLDRQGRYRRFVVQQVTLDVLLDRALHPGDLPADELLWEAAAVLCGTMLMASGTCGSSPDAYDSSTTLAMLLPRIAAFRDGFYDQFIDGLQGQHAARLLREATVGKQPLAGVRQYLNQRLARRRAAQLEHVHLARVYARMGYPRAALDEARIVPVASARMICEVQCRLTTGRLEVEQGQLDRAANLFNEVHDFLQRGIECGALIDPWNILGFHGQFSLFPAPENSVPDHRIEQLVELVAQVMDYGARLWSAAAVRNQPAIEAAVSEQMQQWARWWDRFATTTVESIESFSGKELYRSAREVAEVLKAFQLAGASAGDLAFWRKQVSHFTSPKGYSLVVETLFQMPDLLAAMGLLVQWLGQAPAMPLKQGEASFHALARRWVEQAASETDDSLGDPQKRQALVRRFIELLEANAEDYWQVPTWDLSQNDAIHPLDDEGEEAVEEDELYGAAYDDVVYIDSTQDGIDADMLESGGSPTTDIELDAEARRIGERLTFLSTVGHLWKQASLSFGARSRAPLAADLLARWLEQAIQNERGLRELLRTVCGRKISPISFSRESMSDYERQRSMQEMLIEKVVATAVDTLDAARLLRAAMPESDTSSGATAVDRVIRMAVLQDSSGVRELWPQFLTEIASRPLLYVPVSKGGDPLRLVEARALQQTLRDLLEWLPRLGLFAEACQLIETARQMELANPAGAGAISEFDRLFAAGYEAIVESLVAVSRDWQQAGEEDKRDFELIECLEQVTESLLKQWLAHSRTLRLSVLEKIADEKSWESLVEFIRRYGSDLFTQTFLNLGNLRAILHQGVENWLARLKDEPQPGESLLLIDDLDGRITRAEAAAQMSLILETIVENYSEYRDYNSTTTQSDRGDLLYTLLDFIRLRIHYDRVAWHLKPLVTAHAVLARHGHTEGAETWRRALAERTGELADSLVAREEKMRGKYAMRLPTVADRLSERFLRPLTIDRIRTLVKPAVSDARRQTDDAAPKSAVFELLHQEADELMQEPTGIGFDVPAWLQALEHEVDTVCRETSVAAASIQRSCPIEQRPMALEDVQQQLTHWEREE